MLISKRTYVVSKAIIAYYYTQLIGDPKDRPILRATSNFTDMAVIGQSAPSNICKELTITF
jgi:glucan 1,3-beta-glucosidase